MAVHVPLAGAVEALRAELETAISAGRQSPLELELTSIEVDLQVAVTTERSGKAGVKWWILEAGGEAKGGRSTTQTLRLSLTPRIRGPHGVAGPVLLDEDDDPE